MDLSARGKKRRCLECEEPFYDLNRDPAPCPHCGHANPLDAFVVGKRPPPPPPEPEADEIEDEDEAAIEDDDEDAVIDDEEDEAIDGESDITKVGRDVDEEED